MRAGAIRGVIGAVIISMLAACRSISGTPETLPAPTVTPGVGSGIVLPTVVPFSERHPDLFDENGCLRLGPSPSDVDCGLAPDIPGEVEPSPHPDDSKHLLGFDGPLYTANPSGTGVVLLDGSIAQDGASSWSATGLVRNELATAVGTVTVTATLIDSEGSQLAVVSGPTLIDYIRPGEPAPFQIDSDVPAADVVSVEWAISPSEAAGDDGVRAIEATLFWSQPYGNRERIDSILPADPPEPPYPFTLVGRVKNYGDDPISAPFVVFGWLDTSGRLVYVATTPVRHFTVTEEPVDILDIDGLSGFVIQVNDPVIGPAMTDGTGGLILWTSGN